MQKIADFAPDAIDFLQQYHKLILYRCGFSELSKCDYLTNNVSESFNAQIKQLKGLLLHELVDGCQGSNTRVPKEEELITIKH